MSLSTGKAHEITTLHRSPTTLSKIIQRLVIYHYKQLIYLRWLVKLHCTNTAGGLSPVPLHCKHQFQTKNTCDPSIVRSSTQLCSVKFKSNHKQLMNIALPP